MSWFRRPTVAVVTVTRMDVREAVDSEVKVRTLAELLEVCRVAPPSRVARVSIHGPAGEARFNFASFRRKGS